MERFSDEQLLNEIKMLLSEHYFNLVAHYSIRRKSLRHMCDAQFLLLQRHGKL